MRSFIYLCVYLLQREGRGAEGGGRRGGKAGERYYCQRKDELVRRGSLVARCARGEERERRDGGEHGQQLEHPHYCERDADGGGTHGGHEGGRGCLLKATGIRRPTSPSTRRSRAAYVCILLRTNG